MENWDDGRFALALARNGTIRAAAKALRVNHSTVSRRISDLEDGLGAKLFEQTPKGYVTTAAGNKIIAAAEQMEALYVSSKRRVESADTELKGIVYLDIPDILNKLVCEQLAPFCQQHEKLSLHISSTTRIADIAKREADIALRIINQPPLDMVGKRITQIPIALYGARTFLDGKELDPTILPWVRWTNQFRATGTERAAEDIGKNAPVVARVDTYLTLTSMVCSGAGIAFLCPWFADKNPALQKISALQVDYLMDVWLLIHPDLRGVRRIKAITEQLEEALTGH